MQRIHGKAELLNLGVEALDTGTVGDVGTLTGLGVNKFKKDLEKHRPLMSILSDANVDV